MQSIGALAIPGLRESGEDAKPEIASVSTTQSNGSIASSSVSSLGTQNSPSKLSWQHKRDLHLFGNDVAHTTFDMDVLWRCCELLDIGDVVDCEFINTALEVLSLLHRCEYTVDQTLACLALVVKHAKGSLRKAFEEEQTTFRGQLEFCMHLFLAHVYLVDEPCFLATWYSNVFQDLCTIEDLNSTLMGIFKEQGYRGYRLDVDRADFDEAYAAVEGALHYTPAGTAVLRAIAEDKDGSPVCVHGDNW
jgi:hypothetical protein